MDDSQVLQRVQVIRFNQGEGVPTLRNEGPSYGQDRLPLRLT